MTIHIKLAPRPSFAAPKKVALVRTVWKRALHHRL
jgi:hypothetical protein